jgi:peptidylamidoglycolate lyase
MCRLETGVYKKAKEFVPTETAIDTNGDIFIADGYGAQYITHYDKDGKLKGFSAAVEKAMSIWIMPTAS